MSIKVPVVFTIKTDDPRKAEEYVDRLMRYGFEAILEYEQETRKAIKHWRFAEIRGRKSK